MVVTESGMVMLANKAHPSKALSPMLVTESGMVMLANEVHPSKAPSPMAVTESKKILKKSVANSKSTWLQKGKRRGDGSAIIAGKRMCSLCVGMHLSCGKAYVIKSSQPWL